MAIPSPNAPRMVGTGFSRTKYSVRSRARPAFSLVSSHVWLMAVEIFFDARRNCSRPPEPICSSPDWSCVGSGSSLVRSFSFGLIIQRNRKWRFSCVSQLAKAFSESGCWLHDRWRAIREPVYGDTATNGMKGKPRKNADPITGEPGAHPVGTGVGATGGAVTGAALGAAIGGPIGAAVGTVVGGIAAAYGARGVAEAMNPTTEEEKYWQEHHEKQPLQQAAICLVNVLSPNDENHFVDFVVGREEFAGCFKGSPCCFLNWITIGTATDRRKGNRLDSILGRELQ